MQSIETMTLTQSRERVPYDPVAISHRISEIRAREEMEEPRKKDSTILDKWLDDKLGGIKDGQ